MKSCLTPFQRRWGVFMIVLVIFSLIYWRIKDIDPEGGCRELKYFATCVSVIGEELPPLELFKPLPTDQEMIDKFYGYRDEFEAALRQTLATRSLSIWFYQSPESRERIGLIDFTSWGRWPKKTYEESPIQLSNSISEMAFAFRMASTKYIRGSEQEWPWVDREKGYVYFPSPVPRISNGWLIGPMYGPNLISNVPKGWSQKGWPYPGDRRRIAWRVRDQLNNNWPEDWASFECLLRPIEPQWFLYLCKDQTGG